MNNACTVYRYNDTTKGFDRYYIPHVAWVECRAANVRKTGLQNADSVMVHIPAEYAANAPQTPAKDMLVKGDCPFRFDNSTPQSVSDSLKAFRTNHRYVTASAIDDYRYGGLPHVEVSAK